MHMMEIQSDGKIGTLKFLSKMQTAKHMKLKTI